MICLGDANAVQEGFKVHAILVKNGCFDASLYIKYVRLIVDEGIMPNSALMMGALPLVGELGTLRIGQEAHALMMGVLPLVGELGCHDL
ncbi:hypothetical protein Ahy_A07g036978 isoform C [Arachis hypogaea]|uniref:Uncharacterized protein n=1 Tax=Arachis hypogaea TaxID=3818 RepID=A0A445CHJ3_ARAHY|nr:hypothetical protein Ahy_A07g036978 isoform C [Arachis hypogaea]